MLRQSQSTPNALDPYASAYGIRGFVSPGNIDLNARPVVRNADGSISTVRSISIGVDGLEYVIPTVSDDGRLLSDDDAIAMFESTGRHLGAFQSPTAATRWAERLHCDQEKQYGAKR